MKKENKKEKVYSQGEIYPIIKTEEVEEMINSRINKDLNVDRLNHMIKENKTLEELTQSYEHIRKSWGKADSITKVIGSIIALSTGIGFIVLLVE